jgi:GNAT superfamily N-acetyltransferase
LIRLRPATDGDAAAVAALFSASRRLLTFVPELHSVAEDLGFIRDVVMREQSVTLAERDGALLGFIAETPGWVQHLYVAPDALRSGAGSALLNDAQARQDALELWCYAENAQARAFYERHGFVAVESTDGSGNEAKAPDVRYRWVRRPAA